MKRDVPALMIACTLPLAMAWLGFVALANEAQREQSGLATIYSVGKIAQFSFPLIFVWWFERSQLRTFSLRRNGCGLGVAFGLATVVAMIAFYAFVLRDSEWIADTPTKIFGKLQEFHLATPLGYAGIGLFLAVLHSLLEEYYWRWFVFGWMRRYLPSSAAIAISSLAFMAHHVVILYVYFPGRFWMLAMPLSLGVAVGGAVWAWIYQRTGSLLGPWVSHVIVDCGIMAIGYDMLRGLW